MRLALAVKRLCDIILSFLMLLILSPLFLLIGILIKVDSEGPVFFLQERAGLNGKTFTIWKFRTMCENAVSMGDGFYTGQNDPRITKIGQFLRDWSLDELPQLINILIGDMSIIGPRPTLMYQIEQYDEQQKVRLNMRPGVTGWAQVNGRNTLSWPERIAMDVWYVQNWNLFLDVKIFCLTFAVVINREGVYADQEKFKVRENDTFGQ